MKSEQPLARVVWSHALDGSGATDPKTPRSTTSNVLGALLAFEAFSAFGGGIFGMTGARDIPKQWLEGSPFADYFVPSLVLFVVVGGSLLLAALATFAQWRAASVLAIGAGAILFGWIGNPTAYHWLRVLVAARDGSGCVGHTNPRLVGRPATESGGVSGF